MKQNPDNSMAVVGIVAAGLAVWAMTRPPKEPPKTAGSLADDLFKETGLDKQVSQAVQYVAQEATKGAVAAVKQEVVRYTLPAAFAGVVLGFGLGYLLRK